MNVFNRGTMRLFVAVPVAERARALLHACTEAPRTDGWFQKWVHPNDYHITLKFLGETAPDRLDPICDALRDACAVCAPFALTAESFGSFGPPNAPSVFWAGVSGDTGRLHRVQREVEARLVPLGFAPENRPYAPHITLARKARSASRERLLTLAPPPGARWQAVELVLFRTHMGRSPMYEPVARIPFRGQD